MRRDRSANIHGFGTNPWSPLLHVTCTSEHWTTCASNLVPGHTCHYINNDRFVLGCTPITIVFSLEKTAWNPAPHSVKRARVIVNWLLSLMSVLKAVARALERVAPLRLAAKWDNVCLHGWYYFFVVAAIYSIFIGWCSSRSTVSQARRSTRPVDHWVSSFSRNDESSLLCWINCYATV